MKISNKRELQQIAINHSSDVDFKDFTKICKKIYCITIFFFWLMIQLYHQIILKGLEKIFWNEYMINNAK